MRSLTIAQGAALSPKGGAMKRIIFSLILVLIAVSLISISYDGVFAETKLRNTPSSQKLNEKDIETLVKKCNFFDKKLNASGDCPNDFVDNGDGTITDRATGLMWEQKGSKREKSFRSATKYVEKLNKKKFAGHDDWRIPTIEELYSLLDPNMNKERHINPVFETKPSTCWSIDESGLPSTIVNIRVQYLTVDYEKGTFGVAITGNQPGGSSASNFSSFIRAVRSIQ
jgi:hypothetical protein